MSDSAEESQKRQLSKIRPHGLDVGFQEVVHSVWTVNAEIGERQRFAEGRMDTHKNASLTPKGREMMVRAVVDFGLSKGAAARQFHTTPKTVAKWIERFEAEGVDGLHDRSSWPHPRQAKQGPAQRFLSAHAAVFNTFGVQRHLTSASTHRTLRAAAMSTWREAVTPA